MATALAAAILVCVVWAVTAAMLITRDLEKRGVRVKAVPTTACTTRPRG